MSAGGSGLSLVPQPEQQPRSPRTSSSSPRSSLFPPQLSSCGASQLQHTHRTAVTVSLGLLYRVTRLGRPTTSHAVFADLREGTRHRPWTPVTRSHTARLSAHPELCSRSSALRLRLDTVHSPGHAAGYPGEKVRPARYHPHRDRQAADWLLRSPRALSAAEPRAHDGAGSRAGHVGTAQPSGGCARCFFSSFFETRAG